MPLTSPRTIAPLVVLSLFALVVASCGQSPPTTPSAVTGPGSLSPAVQEFFVVLADTAPPPPAPAAGDPPPGGEPSPDAEGEPPAPPLPFPPAPVAPYPPNGPYPPGAAPWPWPPSPPFPGPGMPAPTPPSTHIRVSVRVDPEPVPYSGVPVPLFSCRDLPHTWYYDQILHGETGIGVTLVERENFFDGRFVSRNNQEIRLESNGTVILRTRWCSGYARPHYTQTRFKGRDDYGNEVILSGPWVRLLAP